MSLTILFVYRLGIMVFFIFIINVKSMEIIIFQIDTLSKYKEPGILLRFFFVKLDRGSLI